MHIDQIAKVMVDKTIEEVQIGYDESEITLFLGDGAKLYAYQNGNLIKEKNF